MPRRRPVAELPQAVRFMLAFFAQLDDPRVDRTKRHSLHNIIVMALCGVISGADGWEDLEEYAALREDWFATFLDLPNGTPSADTFRRVFSALDPAEFERVFRIWVRSMAGDLAGQVVAVDGKTLRGAFERASGAAALHMLHVWAAEQDLLLAHAPVDRANGEIAGIPELLRLVRIEGAIVTADANACTAPITAAIRDAGAHFVLTLKANRRNLYQHVVDAFARAAAERDPRVAKHVARNTGHGRDEQRTVRALRLGPLPANTDADWTDVITVVQVDRVRVVDGVRSEQRHHFITSLPPDAAKLGRVIRTHWRVENSLHWCLDVGFDEDRRKIRDTFAAANFATITRFILALLKREPTSKRGLAAKRRRASWDHDYLLAVLTAGIVAV